MNKDSEKRLLMWVDLETSNLDPKTGAILEVGAIVTTKNLEELGRFQSLVQYPLERSFSFPAFNVDMHSKNGLLEEIAKFPTPIMISPQAVTSRFVHFQRNVVETAVDLGHLEKGTSFPFHPAGSSVHFDVGYLRWWMPSVVENWHHRHVDVSTLKLLYRAWVGDPFGDEDSSHRAMGDVLYSIGIARFFKELWQKRTLPPIEAQPTALEVALAMERENPSRL